MFQDYFSRYVSEQKGATAIEYALLAAGIGMAIIGVVFVIGEDLVTLMTTISDALGGAAEQAGDGS